jgi:hypothetical protein
MRRFSILPVLLVTLFWSTGARALDAAATVECVGGDHLVSVSGFYIEEIGGEIYDGEISGIVFECQAIGVCEPAFFYPETPLPFDPQPHPDGWPVYEAQVTITPPLEGVAYRYIPHGVRPDGTLVATQHHCGADGRSYALASCPDVPITRGTLMIDGDDGGELLFRIDSCSANCWTENVWAYLTSSLLEELAGPSWASLIGQSVDVFGTRTYCSMLGGDYHLITSISPALGDEDCGPVPSQGRSWGGLKAMSR